MMGRPENLYKKITTSVSLHPKIFEFGRKRKMNFSRLLESEIKRRLKLNENIDFEFGNGDKNIYFICNDAETYVKIGISNDMSKRLPMLQVGNPETLKVYAIIKGNERTEKKIHDIFYDNHIRGEWFWMTSDIEKFIEDYKIMSED
jgi:hypothetical protein